MRENAIIRFNDHQEVNGIKEFSIEISIPGKYNTHVTGASQVELVNELISSFEQIFILLGIPQTVQRQLADLHEPILHEAKFFDSDGARLPMSGLAATAKATFEAEVIRNGTVVGPEDDARVMAEDQQKAEG
jgi:hypothetical protein